MESRQSALDRAVRRVGRFVLDALFPDRCASCDREGSALCLNCLAAVAPVPERRALRGGMVVTSYFPYAHPTVRALIGGYKFRDRRALVEAWRSLLGRGVEAAPALLPSAPVTLVPIPLSRRRERRRGFNQAAVLAELLLPQLAPGSVIADPLLQRTRETAQQASQDRRDREKNVRDAFEATERLEGDRHYLLVDDVVTSGETIRSAEKALRAAGARNIQGFAFSHAAPG